MAELKEVIVVTTVEGKRSYITMEELKTISDRVGVFEGEKAVDLKDGGFSCMIYGIRFSETDISENELAVDGTNCVMLDENEFGDIKDLESKLFIGGNE